MIIKVSQGKGFRGVLSYLLRREKAEIIAGNMSGANVRDLSSEFGVSRQMRRDIEKPVFHASLSLPPGERLDDETWARVAGSYLKKMDFSDEHQFVLIRHKDTDHDHVHLVVSRIGLSGKVWKDSMSILRSHDAARAIEREFGLTVVNSESKEELGKPKLKRSEVEKALRENEPPVKLIVSEAVKEAVKDKPDMKTFIDRLNEQGIIAIPNVASTGRMNGFSFVVEGRTDRDGEPIVLKGSDVGAKWSKLKELVDYEVGRDGEFLKAVKEESARRLNEIRAQAGSKDAGGDVAGHIVGDEGDGRHDTAGDGEQQKRVDGVSGDSTGVVSVVEDGDGRSGEGIEETAGSDEDMEIQALLDIADDSDQLRNWLDTAVVVSADSMDAVSDNKGAGDDAQVKVKAHNFARQKRWEEQSRALGAQRYRITCVPRIEGRGTWVVGKKGDSEVFYTPEEVKDMIEMLSAKNAQGYDIYVTPVDPSKHYFLLDDLKKEQVDKVIKAGFEPALVLESSKDNFQVLLVCDRVVKDFNDTEREDASAKRVLDELKRMFGADKNVNLNQPFRMAGFNNKKQTRNNFIVKIHAWSEKTDQQVRKMIDEVKSTIKVQDQQDQQNAKLKKPKDSNMQKPEVSQDILQEFKRLWRKQRDLAYVKVKGGYWEKIDLSIIDFRVACEMLRKGYDASVVEQCLFYSPDIENRHANVADYVDRTVRKAGLQVNDIER